MRNGRGSLVSAKSRKRAARGWWGAGLEPSRRWPGVTISLPTVRRRGRWESPEGRYYFDATAAQRAVDFFPSCLRHHKGEFADQPFKLLSYQDQLIVRPLFGWKRTADGLRRFRKVFLAVPKGNGKSPLAAGLGLYLTFCDEEEGAEVYAAAADRDQAAIVFDTAKIMVEGDDLLSAESKVYRRAIEVSATHSYFRVVSADVRSKHGPNIHGLVIDEFHAQPTRDLYETLYRGTVKRRQPVIFLITTAGDDDESICAEEWEYAQRIISGTITDDTFLPAIFEMAKEDDWKSPEVWKRVNPGYGVTVKADAIAAECQAAQNEPRKLNDFLRYHGNRWVNQATAWIPVDWWDACKSTLNMSELAALRPYAGLDLAQKNDLAAFSLVFKRPLEGKPLQVEVSQKDEESGQAIKRSVSLNYSIDVLSWFWIPEETMREHERLDRVPYEQWEKAGLLTATEGDVIDFQRIYDDITQKIMPAFPLLAGAQCAYDPAFATEIALKLRGSGLKMIEVLQNYKNLNEPSLTFETLIKAKRVRHDGHRVLRWNIENVAVKADDAGRIRPVKQRRRAKRIDGVTAALMALSRLIMGRGGSIYDTRGLDSAG